MNLISNRLAMLLALVSLCFVSCSDDDDNSDDNDLDVGVASVVIYDGEPYDLGKGFFEYYGENEGLSSHDLEIYLVASSLSYDQTSAWMFNGEGMLLYLDFNSPESSLASGTYSYIGKSDDRDPLTVSGGNAFKNYELASKTAGDPIVGGTIKVTNEDGKVTMVIDLITESSTIKGNFSSALEDITQ